MISPSYNISKNEIICCVNARNLNNNDLPCSLQSVSRVVRRRSFPVCCGLLLLWQSSDSVMVCMSEDACHGLLLLVSWQEGPSLTVAFSPTGILQLVAALVSEVPLRLRSCYLSSQPRELSD